MKMNRHNLTSEEFHALVQHQEDPCITLTSPMEPSWPDSQTNRIRVKNLLTKARKTCEGRGLDSETVDKILAPLEDKLDEDLFWSFQFQGLVALLSPSKSRLVQLQRPVEEHLEVGNSFDMRAAAQVQNIAPFRILCVNQGGTAMYFADAYGLKEEQVKDLPASIDETTKYDDRSKMLNRRTTDRFTNQGAGFGSVNYGTQISDSYLDGRLTRYVDEITNAVSRHVNGTREKLYLVASEKIGALIRADLHLSQLSDEHFDINPESLTEQDIHKMVLERIEAKQTQENLERLRNFGEFKAHDRGSLDIEEILREARRGRIERLLIPEGVEMRGEFDEESEEVVFADDAPTDLITKAASETLKKSGEVHLIKRDQWALNDSKAAAFYRF